MRQPALLPAAVLTASLFPASSHAQPSPEGPAFQVNIFNISDQNNPCVAADGMGRFVVVWKSHAQVWFDSGYDIFARRYDSTGSPVGGEFQVNVATTDNQTHAEVAADASGAFIVAWQSQYVEVLARRYSSAGAPIGSEFLPYQSLSGFKKWPDVAMTLTGESVVTWTTDISFNDDIYARLFDSSGTPLATEFRVNTYAPRDQGRSSVSMDPNGGFVIAWEGQNMPGDVGFGVRARRFDPAGAPLGGEFQVNTYSTDKQRLPDVAVANDGSFVIVWKDYGVQPGSIGARGQRFDSAGSPLGTEFQIHTTPLLYFDRHGPRVSMEDDGDFLVLWTGLEPGHSYLSILGQAFDSTSSPVGGEFQVAEGNGGVGSNYYHDIALAPSGEFLAVWAALDQQSIGVFGRKFLPPPCVPDPGIVSDLALDWTGGVADLVFTWTDTPDADDYVLFEDPDPNGAFAGTAGVGSSGSTGLAVPLPPDTNYYLLAPRNVACGLGEPGLS